MKTVSLPWRCVSAALVHDIGKVGIPLTILNKPSKLSDAEFALIKTHVQHSYDVLCNISFTLPIAEIVYSHHEYLDGSGYPRGLRGNRLDSRVADACTSVAKTFNKKRSNPLHSEAP